MNEIKKIEKLVELLHKNCKLSLEQVAAITEMTTAEVASAIDGLEKNGTILGYGAVINWEKLSARNKVTAYIELKVTPQRNNGFNRIAQQICQFDQVKSLSLKSGGYDFGVTVEGDNYVIKVVGTKLVIKGGNELSTYRAAKHFADLVKNSKNTTVRSTNYAACKYAKVRAEFTVNMTAGETYKIILSQDYRLCDYTLEVSLP